MPIPTYVTYSCEVAGPSGRKVTGMIPNFNFAAGYMLDSLISYLLPNWRHFTICLAILSFPFIFLWPLWPKSPRWLYSVGKYKEGEKVIATFAKYTKTDLSTYSNNGKFGEAEFYNELRHQVSRTKSEEDTKVFYK